MPLTSLMSSGAHDTARARVRARARFRAFWLMLGLE